MLTTVDNPFDPFEQFTSWFMFDEEKGYTYMFVSWKNCENI